MGLEIYMKCILAVILTCIAVTFMVAMVLGITAMIQDMLERASGIASSFREWKSLGFLMTSTIEL